MSILNSLFFGAEGNYNILGIPVEFTKKLPFDLTPSKSDKTGLISRLAANCIKSEAFRLVTQGYTHIFVHEMSHALACNLLTDNLFTDQSSKVSVFSDSCVGVTIPVAYDTLPEWKNTIIDTAGPMGNIAFSTCKLVAATTLKSYISWPISLALGSGAVIWMAGELLCAFTSASQSNYGDFGNIAQRGSSHLALASTALVTQCALGIFAAIKLIG